MMTFETFFNHADVVEQSAPGRVNLLGEHTDYNDGFVLPIGTPMRTRVAVAPSGDDRFHFFSENLGDEVVLEPSAHVASGYGRYIEGCIRLVEQLGYAIAPLRVYVRSDVPVGAGLSSSAALEVATLRALRAYQQLPLNDVQLAQLAQQAEHTYAGVQCGIMDQMASSLCDEDHMLFLDTRSLETHVAALPAGTAILVIDSGVARTLGATKYNQRRAECNAAAEAMGIKSLRDMHSCAELDRVDEPYRSRARHVFTENARVQRAAQGASASEFGALMNASHASLRDDYAVSTVELDMLCDMLRGHADVYGARLTGAGFGGACVALCKAGTAATVGKAIVSQYNAAGQKGRVLMPFTGVHNE